MRRAPTPRQGTRHRATFASRLPLLLLAAAIIAGCAGGDRVDDRQYGQQYVCHDGKQTLAVSTADMFVHEQHGDRLGPCPHDG